MKQRILFLFPILIFIISGCRFLTPFTAATAQPPFSSPCSSPYQPAFNIEDAARLPLRIIEQENQPFSLAPGDVQLVQQIADSLQPAGTICDLPVSAETQAVITQADELAKAGKKQAALELLNRRLQQLQASASHAHLAKLPAQSSDWRGVARDMLALAAAVYDAGGDPEPFHRAASQWVNDHAGRELQNADLLQSLRIEDEAGRFGLEALEQQARERASQIATERIDAAIEDFNPCTADREALTQFLNAVAQAQLLGEEGLNEPGEARYDAAYTKAGQALTHQWNAFVRQKGLSSNLLEPEPPCRPAGTVEVRIMSVCSQNWATIGEVIFTSESDTGTAKLSGDGHVRYTEQTSIAGELDCSINIDADVVLTGEFRIDAGVRSVELAMSFSDDGHYTIDIRRSTPPVHQEGIYPFNGYSRDGFVMPWVDGSVHPSFSQTIVQYVLHIEEEE